MKYQLRVSLLLSAMVLAPSLVAAAEPSEARSVIIRDVPHIEQKPDFCGEACVAMALQKLGKPADQDFVFDQSGLSPIHGRGCYTKDLAEAVRNIGFDAGKVWYKIRPASAQADLDRHFQIILADLSNGHTTVVCMHYDDQPDSTEHFRLIVGYDADRDEIIYQEPAISDGDYQRMSRQMLMKLWPLKYSTEEWTAVMMRLRPTAKLRGLTSTEFTDADYAQHIHELKKRLPGDDFHVVLEKPFVVVGNDPAETVQQHSTNTVQWAVNRLKKDYFTKDPVHIVDIWLFRDKDSYEDNCVKLFGEKPGTPFGYYSSSDQALLVKFYHEFCENVASDPTGYKTLQNVLGTDDREAFKQRWEAYTAGLRF